MRHVYQNAFCNFAATGSSNSHAGLFFERDPSLVPMRKVEVRWEGGFPRGEYCFYPERLWDNGVVSAPLNRRAWVVQERLLARRVIHFGAQGLFFECCEHEASETFPRGLPKAFHSSNSINQFKHIYQGGPLQDHLEVYRRWERIVLAFMRSDLTKASDKAIALSGIAEEFQHLIKQSYIAGLWQTAFDEQLLWMVIGERQANGRASQRPTPYRAPSWSWLSIDGDVKLASLGSNPTLIDVKHIHIDLLDKNHPTGQIKGGHIVMCCQLLSATHGARISSDPNIPQNYLLFNGQEIGTTQIFFDEAARKPAKNELIFCVPISYERNTFRISGLVLSPTTGERGAEYQRIGLFKAAEKEFFDKIDGNECPSRNIIDII